MNSESNSSDDASTNRQRLTKVTTRAGDKGKTKLATGRTITKYSQVVRVMGSVDELNSYVGVLLTHLEEGEEVVALKDIQQNLFNMGAVFAMEGQYDAPENSTLESLTETMNARLPPLTEFVLPGGGPAAASAHVCRAVCRRAETEIWALLDEEKKNYDDVAHGNILKTAQYVNRLSDYFFVLARTLTTSHEEQWSGPKGNR